MLVCVLYVNNQVLAGSIFIYLGRLVDRAVVIVVESHDMLES